MAVPTVRRRDVLSFRVRRHELDQPPSGARPSSALALLPYGVQDTGPDGATWAFVVRGARPPAPEDVALLWTLRGAPHLYPRASVAVATAPYSERDAAKRVVSAAKPLRAAGVPVLDALRTIAQELRAIVTKPLAKGEVSQRVTAALPPHFSWYCKACDATHVSEMAFRLAALHAGLELEPGTSPPVLRRVPRVRPPLFERLAGDADPRFDVIRNYLRFYGPARVRDVAEFLDAPRADIDAHWPTDVVEVAVRDDSSREPRFVLEEDLSELRDAPTLDAADVRLLGPYDPYLQGRDRELLVPDKARHKELWPVLGRPGVVLRGGEVIGTWRPRTSGRSLALRVQLWTDLRTRARAALDEQAALLAAHRDLRLSGVEVA